MIGGAECDFIWRASSSIWYLGRLGGVSSHKNYAALFEKYSHGGQDMHPIFQA